MDKEIEVLLFEKSEAERRLADLPEIDITNKGQEKSLLLSRLYEINDKLKSLGYGEND